MNEQTELVVQLMETSGVLAPIAFIALHLVRQFLFIPVIIVCLAGGYLFGVTFGTMFSLIGLTFSSLINYHLFEILPDVRKKFYEIKRKRFSPYVQLTTGQIAVLKMFPIMNYQLLNLFVMEKKPRFGPYAVVSFITNIPVVLLYSFLGRFLQLLTLENAIVFTIILFSLVILLRQRFVTIKWKDFF